MDCMVKLFYECSMLDLFDDVEELIEDIDDIDDQEDLVDFYEEEGCYYE